MPATINGIGTMYYGQREVWPDGSNITTEWITLFWVPVIPIASYRVLPEGSGTNYIVYQSQRYIARRVPLNVKQVCNVYLVAVPIALGLIAVMLWANYRIVV